ncbi:hypothetical protein MMC18_007284 [Xylographa bjoerkii]|nr:hypothetical protein [Xylographa bjoerkii]
MDGSSKTPFLSKGTPRSSCSIDEERLDDSSFSSGQHQRMHYYLSLTTIARASAALLATWGLISLCLQLFSLLYPAVPDVYRPSTLPVDRNLCDCGTTIADALVRNCVYDSLAAAWLPPYCRDDELTADFDRSGPGSDGAWPYFADANGTVVIHKSQIAALGEGERVFYSSRDWHIAHCLFYWEKLIRMRDTGAVMERRFDRVAHARHCRRLAMNKMPEHTLLIDVPVMMNARIVE